MISAGYYAPITPKEESDRVPEYAVRALELEWVKIYGGDPPENWICMSRSRYQSFCRSLDENDRTFPNICTYRTNAQNYKDWPVDDDQIYVAFSKEGVSIASIRASEWLKKVENSAEDLAWFNSFAALYDSRLEAAIDYLGDTISVSGVTS